MDEKAVEKRWNVEKMCLGERFSRNGCLKGKKYGVEKNGFEDCRIDLKGFNESSLFFSGYITL